MGETGFSFRSRAEALRRFRDETFDLLIIGGGITGAGVARDAVSRGLRVALVEKSDFASGTSSRSSKLIHGGLRYLQNLELHLVFEALSERSLLLRTAPHLVHPLKFYLPVYKGDEHGRAILSLGLWLYDLLALFRAPGSHRSLSRKAVLAELPFLKAEGLKGGFQYYDASMWDDALAVETVRAAANGGAAVANYVEATAPIWDGDRIAGFHLRDRESGSELEIRASRTIVCAGPWTDLVGTRLSGGWRHWLKPSKGVHLIFDLKRIPVPGAMVMTNPSDGRISFVIPRPEFGAGVVIVGTTDGPSPAEPDKAEIEASDIGYLMDLLNKYFPGLALKPSDIVSAYIGVRPLMGSIGGHWQGREHLGGGDEGGGGAPASLQKVSREHHIDTGPGGTVVVAGGKYTTHRKMAEEIVDYTLSRWKKDHSAGLAPSPPERLRAPETARPVNPSATREAILATANEAAARGIALPRKLIDRYGTDALQIWLSRGTTALDRAMLGPEDPEGFPLLLAQLRHSIRSEMALHLTDFYLRRTPLFASRADHGLPWCEALGRVWAEELGRSDSEARAEIERLHAEVAGRSDWAKTERYDASIGKARPGTGV